MKRIAWLVAMLTGGLPCAPAPAQTLQSMYVYYPQQVPHVWLDGISPFYWAPQSATVTVQGRSISIFVCPPDVGFSVIEPWSLSVPLPALPSTAVYDVGVYLDCRGNGRNQIGFLSAWIAGGM